MASHLTYIHNICAISLNFSRKCAMPLNQLTSLLSSSMRLSRSKLSTACLAPWRNKTLSKRKVSLSLPSRTTTSQATSSKWLVITSNSISMKACTPESKNTSQKVRLILMLYPIWNASLRFMELSCLLLILPHSTALSTSTRTTLNF